MNGVIAWFAENRVAANMLMFIILVAGALAIPATQKEIFPNVSLDKISISVIYPGASPSEVEEAVCTRVERSISGIDGIESISAVASEALCSITAEIGFDSDTREVRDKIKARIDSIPDFPSAVERPIINEISLNTPVARIVISGQASHRALRRLAERVRQDLNDLGISRVVIGDAKPYEISIEIPEFTLQQYNLTFAEVAETIRRNSNKMSGGSVATQAGSVTVSAVVQVESIDDFRNLVLSAQPDGGRVTLGDVATITDGFEEGNTQTFYDGEPSVQLMITQEPNLSILEMSQILGRYMDNPQHMPQGVSINLDFDLAEYFKARLDILLENAIAGLILVFITLLLFLNFRLSFWVSTGIIVSFMGAFIILYLTDGSINMISTFAFLIVLGMVVDDAIIIAENIHTNQEELGKRGLMGAIAGAQEISKPVIFAVITTAVAFAPLLFLPGPDGKMLASIPTVVLATLLFSLIESLFILPAHLAHQPAKSNAISFLKRVQDAFSNTLQKMISAVYKPSLEIALKWRYSVFWAFTVSFFLACALLIGGWVNVNLISDVEGDGVFGTLKFPPGTHLEETSAALKRMEHEALALKDELEKKYGADQILHIRTNIATPKDNEGFVAMTLAGAQNRQVSGEQVAAMWRERVGPIPHVAEIDYTATFNKPGPPINIDLKGHNPEELKAAAKALREHLEDYPAVYGVRDSFQGGSREVQLRLKPNAYDLGIDLSNLGAQVRQAFQGTIVQTLQRDGSEVQVVLRYPKEERSSLWHLENMRVRLGDGTHVPLSAVADVYYGTGPAKIIRHDGRRSITVSAYVDEGIANSTQVMTSLRLNFLSKLDDRFPGVKWSPAGQQKVRTEIMEYLATGFLIALGVMFMLMATLFRSYLQPSIVMTAIPFGLVGAMGGHLLLGLEMTLWSLAGMIAVSGVVVNDNMVLIFYINDKREQGYSISDAVKAAGAERFRPIMLTTLTTVAGLMPILTETSWEAQFLIPMATSISFGVLFATLVSLVLIPVLYLILDDFGGLYKLPLIKEKSSHGLENKIVSTSGDDKIFDDAFGGDEPQSDRPAP